MLRIRRVRRGSKCSKRSGCSLRLACIRVIARASLHFPRRKVRRAWPDRFSIPAPFRIRESYISLIVKPTMPPFAAEGKLFT